MPPLLVVPALFNLRKGLGTPLLRLYPAKSKASATPLLVGPFEKRTLVNSGEVAEPISSVSERTYPLTVLIFSVLSAALATNPTMYGTGFEPPHEPGAISVAVQTARFGAAPRKAEALRLCCCGSRAQLRRPRPPCGER